MSSNMRQACSPGLSPDSWILRPSSLVLDTFRCRDSVKWPYNLCGSCTADISVPDLAQAGCGWSVAAGTGLVVARRGEQGGWSPPSALGLYSLGWGLQIGGSLCDLLIVLRNQ